MNSGKHWLLEAALLGHPEVALAADLAIAPNLSDAWAQVCGLFHISAADLAARVAKAHGLEQGSLKRFQPGEGSCLPERMCRELQLVPLWHERDLACIAVSDPRFTQDQSRQLSFAAKRPVELVVLDPQSIDTCQTRLFAQPQRSGNVKTQVIDLLDKGSLESQSSNVKLVGAIFKSAVDQNASDIHIHPFVGGGAIRFRVDGVMRRIATLPIESLESIARYLKTHAGLEPNPLKPQDGRLRLKYGQREIDVRLSILPVYDGDRIVCRLLDQSRNFSLQHSRFSAADQQALRRLVGQSAGIVLLTGPTGSGKTSTLYALLTELNGVDVNIMTIEDPVEYVLPGISQVQVNDKQGLSFADTLRSILRQDPDVVLVGEIRDEETARIALQASLTGHLVLSTLHTNDALGAIPRLLDLSLDASVLADALIGVVSQRLVRGLCEDCRQPRSAPTSASEDEFKRITGEYPAYRPVGCEKCGYTGFKGRLPLIEYVEMGPNLRQALLTGGRSLATLQDAVRGHRRSMAASAKAWIVSGQTTPLEVQKILGLKFWTELAQEHGKDVGALNFSVSEGQADKRMKLLLISGDAGLAKQLGSALPYGVEHVGDETAALQRIEKLGDVMALVIDSGLCTGTPVAWMVALRTALASTGLPVLFVVREGTETLQMLLERYGAQFVKLDEIQTAALPAAFNRLLQGANP
jgi:type II secretory ATPase GspE/PulE/Tfp pilus assembly ATPase PilB-like protein